jgi:hypothetical protein
MQNEPEKKEEEALAPISDDALASFNNEFKLLQEKYSLRIVGIPLINTDGRITVSIQALPVKHEQGKEVVSPYKD